MLDLEGTKFLENFNTMYLRRNKLVSIPLYLLSNTLDKSPDGRSLFLEGNQLHCDCNSAKVLKVYRFYNSFDFFSSSNIPLSLSLSYGCCHDKRTFRIRTAFYAVT